MTEKRFHYDYKTGRFKDTQSNSCATSNMRVLETQINNACYNYEKKIKELEKENKKLKSILQDMGLIMSNEEVKNVRDEIASKLIKPLCKGNGFDVDVNTEKGFTIIPKGVNNDRE